MNRTCTQAAVAVTMGLALASAPASTRAENLTQAWDIALRVNGQLQSQRLQTNAAGLDLASARSARLPTVTSSNYNVMLTNSPSTRPTYNGVVPSTGSLGSTGSTGSTHTTGSGSGGSTGSGVGSSVSALPAGTYISVLGRNQTDLPISYTTATLPLYTGGRLKRNIDAAGYQVTAQRTEEFRSALDLKLTVAEAYIGVLRARRNLETTKSNVEQLTSFARDTRNRRVEGLATRADELAAQTSLSNAQLNEIQARTTLETAWATYDRYLCRPLSATTDLDEIAALPEDADWSELARKAVQANSNFSGMSEPEIAALTGQALRGRPELAGLTAQARALDAQADVALSNIRPQAQVSGGFIYTGANNFAPNGNGLLNFSLNWNITDSGATRRRTEAIRERERATVARRADQAADIALQVRSRWLDLQRARLAVPISRVAVASAEENTKVVNDRYRQGLSTYTEVLDAETRRITSLFNFYNAVYDEGLATFRLRRAVGDI